MEVDHEYEEEVDLPEEEDDDDQDEDFLDYQQHYRWGRGLVQPYLKLLPRTTGIVNESVEINTFANKEHTFNGIMFDIEVSKEHKPVDFVLVESFYCYGGLGRIGIYVTKKPGRFQFRHNNPDEWRRIHNQVHAASFNDPVELKLDEPIKVQAGEMYGVYIHSEEEGDDGIVYDNTSSHANHAMPGKEHGTLIVRRHGIAHLSHKPFVSENPWGWGDGWRREREFVGRVKYGVRYFLWSPENHMKFPPNFKQAAYNFIACGYRDQNVVGMLPQEIVLYILNLCNWDYFGDGEKIAEDLKKKAIDPSENNYEQPVRMGPHQWLRRFEEIAGVVLQDIENQDDSDSDDDYVEEQEDDTDPAEER